MNRIGMWRVSCPSIHLRVYQVMLSVVYGDSSTTTLCLKSYSHSRLLFLLHGLFQCRIHITYYTVRFERNHPYFKAWLETLLEIKSIGITLFFRFRWFPVECFYSLTVLFYSKIGIVQKR